MCERTPDYPIFVQKQLWKVRGLAATTRAQVKNLAPEWARLIKYSKDIVEIMGPDSGQCYKWASEHHVWPLYTPGTGNLVAWITPEGEIEVNEAAEREGQDEVVIAGIDPLDLDVNALIHQEVTLV